MSPSYACLAKSLVDLEIWNEAIAEPKELGTTYK